MTITMLGAQGTPLASGLRLELIGDGQVLGRARVQDNGEALFDPPPGNVLHLSVRLAREQDASGPLAAAPQ